MKQQVHWIPLQKMKYLKDINSLNNKTIIMISHRMNTLKYCDKIYLMDKGEIRTPGSYDKFNEKY